MSLQELKEQARQLSYLAPLSCWENQSNKKPTIS